MKKLTAAILACILCAAASVAAFAANYEFSSGPASGDAFGKATSTDEPAAPDPMSVNTRRNKDNSALPPPYFHGSGDLPTGASSPYHNNLPEGGFAQTGQQYPALGGEGNAPGSGSVSAWLLPSTSVSAPQSTEPKYYEDGSIGSLSIAGTGKTMRVFEGESLDSLKKGAGHFSSTSAWDGNVALCGHNRGSWPYFSFVKDMRAGDRVTYTTQYGSRAYEVYSVEQISELDSSKLGWSAENILTLITCVADEPELRWAAQLREVQQA